MAKYIVKFKETRVSDYSIEVEASSKEQAELQAERNVFRFADVNDGVYISDITVLTEEEYKEED